MFYSCLRQRLTINNFTQPNLTADTSARTKPAAAAAGANGARSGAQAATTAAAHYTEPGESAQCAGAMRAARDRARSASVARSGVEDACTCVQDVSDEMLQACARWCAGLRAHLLS